MSPDPSENSVQLEVVSLQPGEYYIQYHRAILRMLEEYVRLDQSLSRVRLFATP